MKDVFDAYPKVDTIYVVEGMPFFDKVHAQNHAGGDLKKVQIVTREEAELAAAEPEMYMLPKIKGRIEAEETTPPAPKGEEVGGDADTPPAPKGEEVGGDADTPPAPKGEDDGGDKNAAKKGKK